MELKDKNALITGSAKRIGKALALALADLGINIIVHYNTSEIEAEKTVKEIRSKNVKSHAVQANLENITEIEKLIDTSQKKLGTLDILINNAAIFYPVPIEQVTEEEWQKFMNTNLRSNFFLIREFASKTKSGLAKIINMGDAYATSPIPDFLLYAISKGGLITLTKGLSKAYAPNILINTICPGPIIDPVDANKKRHKKAIKSTLLKRAGGLEAITSTAIYILKNDYITGQSIFIDGGKTV